METKQAKLTKDNSLRTRAKTAIVIGAFFIVYIALLLFSSWQWFEFNNDLKIKFILNFINLLMIIVLLYFAAFEITKLNKLKRGMLVYTVISMFTIVVTSDLYFLVTRSFFNPDDNWETKQLIYINIASWGCLLLYLVNQIIITIMYKKKKVDSKLIVFWYPFLTFFLTLFFNVFFYVGIIHVWTTFVFMIVISIGSDIFGYIFGVKFGKHKLAPKISPKKSWEGLISSYLFTLILVIGLMCIFWFIPSLEGHYKTLYSFIGCQVLQPASSVELKPYYWAIYVSVAFVLITLSVLGDLFFSYVKRRFNIKDFSNLLPGHGGILDRLDAFTFMFILYFLTTIICQLATNNTQGMGYLWLGNDLSSLV